MLAPPVVGNSIQPAGAKSVNKVGIRLADSSNGGRSS
jgi:hypothetical protein